MKAQENLIREFLARTPIAKQTFNLDDLTHGVAETVENVLDSEGHGESDLNDLPQEPEENTEEFVPDSQDGSDWDPLDA